MALEDGHQAMSESETEQKLEALSKAIALAEDALAVCDEHGFVFAAIDISSALDKLKALKGAAQT